MKTITDIVGEFETNCYNKRSDGGFVMEEDGVRGEIGTATQREWLATQITLLINSAVERIGKKEKEIKDLRALDLTQPNGQEQLWAITANNRAIGFNSALTQAIQILKELKGEKV